MSSQTATGLIVVDGGDSLPGTLTIEVAECDITSMWPTYGPDPEWTYTDEAGHFHAYSLDGPSLPTLEGFEVAIGVDDDGDVMTRPAKRCRACGETVEPGRIIVRQAYAPASIPGMTSWRVTVRIPHGQAIGYAAQHSVRVLRDSEGERFGFAVGTALTDDGEACSMTLVGNGPLGSR